MSTLTYVIIFSIGGGLISLIGGLLIISKQSFAHKFATLATPFAAGALLAAVFFDLLPEGVEITDPHTVFTSAVVGILLFFLLEKGLHFFHHHRHGQNADKDPNRFLVIAGDTLHNAIDGVVIAAGFLVSIPTGIATTLAVIAHEIPQEIGDFGLLLSKGMSRGKVILVNIVSALATFVFAVLTYFVGSSDQLPLGVLLGLSAGFLLYIAMSDIIPNLHAKNGATRKVLDASTALLIAGVIIVGLLINLTHGLVPHDHGCDEAEHALEEGSEHDDDDDEHDDECEDDHDNDEGDEVEQKPEEF
jgi:zinc and cadmium transporter